MPQSQLVEVQLYRFLKNFRGKKMLLAVSGGLDSVALFRAFCQVAPKHQVSFVVAHIHHGLSKDAEQLRYRDQCLRLTQQLCKDAGVSFFSNDFVQQKTGLKKTSEEVGCLSHLSEAALRAFRLQELKKIFKRTKCDYVVFAHHAEDLLETRLIRLIRGTGGQGLTAMSEIQGKVLRPFLSLHKNDLQNYLQDFPFCEDPSNGSTRYLRNWLRLKWLPLLEKQRPGALQSLGKSLEAISRDFQLIPSLDFCFEDGRIVRSEYLTLAEADKSRVWAVYLKQQGLKNYGLSHIRELSKRLDVEQKDLTFRLLKKRWLANARHIWCESENTVE